MTFQLQTDKNLFQFHIIFIGMNVPRCSQVWAKHAKVAGTTFVSCLGQEDVGGPARI